MISDRLRKRAVYSDRPIRETRIIIDRLTKHLALCVEAAIREGVCTETEAEELVLSSLERYEKKFRSMNDERLEKYLDMQIAKVELAEVLLKAGVRI